MQVVMHCGAHRTGAAGFQDYMDRYGDDLRAQDVMFCAPRMAERPCAVPTAGYAQTEFATQVQQAKNQGAKQLVISDMALLGDLQQIVKAGALYPDVKARIAATGLSGRVDRVVLCLRGLEAFWVSALAQAVHLGAAVPDKTALRHIAFNARSWQDVIRDLAAALPKAQIDLFLFESYRGQPERFAAAALGLDLPKDTARSWMNRAPSLPQLRRNLAERGDMPSDLPFGMGPWNPFCAEELGALRERFADDMMWLVGGADGLARLTEDRSGTRAGSSQPSGSSTKGQTHGVKEGHLARPG